ncbi:MAG: hypothetical protein KC931_27515, partial [Candidatus Omnitrophica bacterium]|nr:hypothetical protein [Candidatus Omnitrophota bacterium]
SAAEHSPFVPTRGFSLTVSFLLASILFQRCQATSFFNISYLSTSTRSRPCGNVENSVLIVLDDFTEQFQFQVSLSVRFETTGVFQGTCGQPPPQTSSFAAASMAVVQAIVAGLWATPARFVHNPAT